MEYSDYLLNILNKEEIDKLNECYKKDEVHGLRVNLLKANQDDISSLLDLKDRHEFVNEAFVYKGETKYGKNPLHHAGTYYIQEPSAMMVSYLLDIKEDDKVLDLCAAPGGKSSQVLSYLKGSGVLVCNDISNKRALVLSENIERMGASNCYVLNEDIDKIENRFKGYFDKVILDAPCSGMGMFRKNDLVYKDWTYNKTLALAKTNKELILKAYSCLKKGGVMVYSTCTFTNEENEDVIKYLLENTNASVIKIKDDKSFYKSSVDGAIRLYPFLFNGEGHFICLIRCNDEHECNVKAFNKLASKKEIMIYKEFEKKYLNISLDGDFIMMGNNLHYLGKELFSLKDLKVLRNGLHLGEINKDRFIPNHAFALFLKREDVKMSLNYGFNDNNINNYLKGLTLDYTMDKGYVLVCVNNYSLGWGKSDGRIIKNLYPKGLRVC